MKKKLTTVAFHGTPEQEEKLIAVIDAHKDAKGAMMPILQGAQEIYGYLPVEVQRIIALRTGVSLEEIYGIASFYAQFKLNPDGEVAVAVCLGTACYVKGSGEIIEECSKCLNVPVGSTSVDGRYSLEVDPVHRRLRSCPGYDCKRRGLRTAEEGRGCRYSGKIPVRITRFPTKLCERQV